MAELSRSLYEIEVDMESSTLLGGLVVVLAGVSMGSGAWILKVLRKLAWQHLLCFGVLFGLIIFPWVVVLAYYPHPMLAIGSVWAKDPMILIKSNLFALGWGIANILCMVCFVRIGVALTGGILGGLGLSLGVVVPMVFKASGLFNKAPNPGSPAGIAVLCGVGVMLVGVVLVSVAGFGRDRALRKLQATSGNFLAGLIMVVIAGVLSAFPNFSFAYSQGPLTDALNAQRASTIVPTFAVWAVGLLAGAIVNVIYGAYAITKAGLWGVLKTAKWELLLPLLGAVQTMLAFVLLGEGSVLLGAMGASVGWGIYQGVQIASNQSVGFLWGEWHGVTGAPRKQMYAAIVVLVIASIIMAYGNSLVRR